MACTILIQRPHLGSCVKLSAPISHTNSAQGNFAFNAASVLAVCAVPKLRSISVAMIRRPSAIRRADSSRSSSFAIPIAGFNGFPGETISHS